MMYLTNLMPLEISDTLYIQGLDRSSSAILLQSNALHGR